MSVLIPIVEVATETLAPGAAAEVATGLGLRGAIATVGSSAAGTVLGNAASEPIIKFFAELFFKKPAKQIITNVGENVAINVAENVGLITAENLATNVGENLAITASENIAIDTGENVIGNGAGDIIDQHFGSGIAITDVTEETIAGETVAKGITVTMLEKLGISEASVGKETFNFILGAIAANIITDKDIQNALENNVENLFNDIVDTIAGDNNFISDPGNFIIIGSNGELIDPETVKTMSEYKFVDCFELGYSTGIMLTSQAYETYKLEELGLDRNKANLLATIISQTKNPESAFISKKLTQFLTSTDYIKNPNQMSGIVKQLSSVYNNQVPEPFLDAEKNTHLIDELGKEHIFHYSEDNLHNVFGYKFKTPQLHGEYVGPGSTGGALPIDEFDRAAALHDARYDELGYFSHEADLELLARIDSYLTRHPVSTEIDKDFYDKILFTKFYFSYIGPMASHVVGNYKTDFIEEFTSGNEGDLFDSLFSEHLPKQDFSTFGYKNPVRKYAKLLKDDQRTHFYAGLKAGIDQNSKLIYNEFMIDKSVENFDNLPLA